MRLVLLLVLLNPFCVGLGTAQTVRDFQVATVKPSAPETERYTQIRGNKFAAGGITVQELLLYAYSVHPSQIVGGPDWLRSEKFDVLADPETEKRPSSEEMKAMVGRLLGDRFHLVLRREKRELPVYALVRTSKEIKFTRDDGEAKGLPTATGGFEPPGTLAVRNGTLANLAAFLQRFATSDITRPVVDQTGIAGHFDFDLRYTPVSSQFKAQGADGEVEAGSPPGLFTAIQEQLGLKLEATRADVDVLRVESILQPTEN
ncbi:CHP03435 domain-containing protein [Granulicella sibirica]|uniref:CHP03435 domain-containing protein n=2 Tax=Granulicella sibirica TaxID=2479048 RepID=A0A4Q0T155_9BACT|nr:CHP03435 domain-containing protein [Granulicella sibirica]